MKRILTVGLALALAGFSPPLEAAPKHHQAPKARGHHPAAVAQHRPKAAPKAVNRGRSIATARHQSPRVQHRPTAPRQSPAVATARARQQQHLRSQAQIAASAARKNQAAREQAVRNQVQRNQTIKNRTIAAQRSRAEQARRTRDHSIAFGGSTRVNQNTVNNRLAVRNQTYNIERPPYEVHRNWDRHRFHEWNHHRYRWHNGSWIVFQPAYTYSYDYGPAYTFEVSLGAPTVREVQAALDREGYDPGPIDGVIGSLTRDAIAAYQEDHGLDVTGRISSDLLRSLDLS